MPERIDLRAYKNAIFAFHKERRCCEDPTYEGGGIAVRPRKGVGRKVEGEGDVISGDGDEREVTERKESSIDT